MYTKKLIKFEVAQNGNYFVRCVFEGNGGKYTVNSFDAEDVCACLASTEAMVKYYLGQKLTTEDYLAPEQLVEKPAQQVENFGRVTYPLDGKYYFVIDGKPRVDATGSPILFETVDLSCIWDYIVEEEREFVNGRWQIRLNPYDGGKPVKSRKIDQNTGEFIRKYRKSWSPEERFESMVKAGMLVKDTSFTKVPAQDATVTPTQPNAATITLQQQMAEARRLAAEAAQAGGGTAPAPEPTPTPGGAATNPLPNDGM